MSIPQTIKDFNSILESFLQQVSPLVGTSYHHYYTKLIKFNSLMPIQYFITYALPMEEKIMSKDESYFINNDNHKEIVAEQQLGEILRLQGIWSQLDKRSKNEVWDIFQALTLLSKEYIQLKK